MRSDTLTDMVAHMRDKVGLVHQMPFVSDRPGLPSTLEQVRIVKQAHYMCINGSYTNVAMANHWFTTDKVEK